MTLLRNRRLWVVLAAGIGLALFLGVTAQNKLGFPLDDAWIHQTYARNLARNGRLEFTPGVSSAGSTAPLWTVLLAVGYLLGVPYLLWAYLLGGICLVWLAWSGMRLWRAFWPAHAEKDWLAGIVLVLTWPLLWAAVSGMETLFFAALGLQLTVWYIELVKNEKVTLRTLARLGFFAGLLILIRPDGFGLLLLIFAGVLLLSGNPTNRLRRGGVLLGTAVFPLIPYFLFNFFTSGTIWPNTLYAKQVEYAAVLAQPFGTRFSQLLFLSLGGPASGWRGVSSPHLLLLPGLVFASWQAIRADWAQKRLFYLLPLFWAGGHVLLYAWRLPVTFQHGRYLIPIMPVWVLYGLAGWVLVLLYSSSEYDLTLWLGRQVARLSFTIILLFFLLQGAFAFATDVAIVEGEMVAVAGWLAKNTPPDALIASHDIGAIGYFAERPLLDLAGLISPEVIPLLENEDALTHYILASEADYLVTAPGWPYTQIVTQSNAVLRFTSGFTLTTEQGLNNMTIYELLVP